MENLVFFKKEGEEGVALTSTSANYIANLAKECIQSAETELNNISFVDVYVSLVGGTGNNTIQVGKDKEFLDTIKSKLEKVAQAKSLIAWLRESIKARDCLLKDLQNLSIDDWCEKMGIPMPKIPKCEEALTEEDFYASLPIKERNRYFQLETEAAVFGKYIHPDGGLANARKFLKDKLQHPHSIVGEGRDALVYSYIPTTEVYQVDKTFFELQQKHREIQAQLNTIKHTCEQAVNESLNKVNSEYAAAYKEYNAEINSIAASYKSWRDLESQRISKLKITLPNSLLGIYDEVRSLGK
mgnify:FL=1